MDKINQAVNICNEFIDSPILNDSDRIMNMDLPEKPDVSWYMRSFTVADAHRVSNDVRRLSAEEEKALFLRYNLARKQILQLKKVMNNPQVQVGSRLAIQKWYKIAMEARQLLAEYNLALVIAGMKSFLKSGLDFDDLLSEGNAALLKAINKFDVTKGNKFSTYATWAIKNALIRELGRFKHRKEHFGVSLDPSLGNGEDEEHDVIDEQNQEQEEYLIEVLQKALKEKSVGLSGVERQVVDLRYLSEKKKTYNDIGGIIGLSREWVRHHNKNALAKLRKFFEQHA